MTTLLRFAARIFHHTTVTILDYRRNQHGR